MAQITYKDDPVAYSMHQKIGYTTLYYPLIVHGKFNNRWKHGVDCGVNTGSYSIVSVSYTHLTLPTILLV